MRKRPWCWWRGHNWYWATGDDCGPIGEVCRRCGRVRRTPKEWFENYLYGSDHDP